MEKKPLAAMALSVLLGLFLGERFLYYPVSVSLVVVSLLLLESILRQGKSVSFLFFLPGAIGFLVYQVVSTPFLKGDLRSYVNGGPIRLVARVEGPPRHYPDRVALPMKGTALYSEPAEKPPKWHPASGFFTLTIYSPTIPFEYGDHLEMMVQLKQPSQFQNPGAFQYADYRNRTGYSGMATLPGPGEAKKVGEGGYGLLKRLYRWRETIRLSMVAAFHEGQLREVPLALFMALIIGEDGYLTEEIRDVFSASGTTHILSISGSHLALVSFLIFGLIRGGFACLPAALLLRISLFKTPAQWAAFFTAAPVAFYAYLAGGEIATLRSLTMILVYLLSVWLGRSGEVTTSLSLAALLILAFDPLALFDLSFQLSFVSVLSIALAAGWWQDAVYPPVTSDHEPSRFQKYIVRPGQLMLCTNLGATIGAAPLTLFYFHQFSWVGLVSNFIIIPMAGWIMVPFGLICAVASLFSDTGLPLGMWHQRLGSFYYQWTSFFAHFPGADAHFASPMLWTVVSFYGAVFCLLLWRAPWQRLASVIVAFFVFFLGWGGIRMAPDSPRVTFLDVGQGDATLLEFPGGKTMLIDGGAGGNFSMGKVAIAPYLWQRRVRHIDYLVATHPDMDHVGGLTYLVRKFQIGEIWTNGMTRDSSFYQEFIESMRQKGLAAIAVDDHVAPLTIDACRIFFLNPSLDRGETDYNNHSIVMRLVCSTPRPLSILFTGDIEKKGEEAILKRGYPLSSAILKVPHHGSRGSLSWPFLAAVSPEYAIFSVGDRNRYRHPHPEVLTAYTAVNAKIYRTDKDGAMTVGLKKGETIVTSYVEGKVQKIRWNHTIAGQEWDNIKRAMSPL